MPFFLRMNSQPAKSNGISDDGERNQDIRPPSAEIGETADNEEDDDLNGEGDSIAEKNNAVDRAFGTGKEEDLTVASGLVEQILKGRWGEICNASERRGEGGWRRGIRDQGHVACLDAMQCDAGAKK